MISDNDEEEFSNWIAQRLNAADTKEKQLTDLIQEQSRFVIDAQHSAIELLTNR